MKRPLPTPLETELRVASVRQPTQRARVLAALRMQPLTTVQARQELKVMHPAGRIMEIRKAGYRVRRTWVEVTALDGSRHRVACYRLIVEDGHMMTEGA